jgi:integrase
MAALWADFERDPVTRREGEPLRPKSLAAYRSWWTSHLEPSVARLKVADVTRERVAQLHREVTIAAGRPSANRALALVSRMMSRAEELGLVAANPCRGVKRHKEPGRERVLSPDELVRLVRGLHADPSLEARLVEVLLATASRRGETLQACWADVDLERAVWVKPAHTTKGKRAHRVVLAPFVVELFEGLPRRGERVFEGLSESRLSKWWQRKRVELAMPDVKIHDLRHEAGSALGDAGIPEHAIRAALGHAPGSKVTAGYLHARERWLLEAAKAAAARLEALRDAEPAGRA